MHAQYPAADPALRQHVRGRQSQPQDPAGRYHSHILAFTQSSGDAQLELFSCASGAPSRCSVESQIACSRCGDQRIERFGRFPVTTWSDHRNTDRAQYREILGSMMRHAKRTVTEATSDRDDFHICLVVCSVVSNLFEAAESGEIT